MYSVRLPVVTTFFYKECGKTGLCNQHFVKLFTVFLENVEKDNVCLFSIPGVVNYRLQHEGYKHAGY